MKIPERYFYPKVKDTIHKDSQDTKYTLHITYFLTCFTHDQLCLRKLYFSYFQ